MIGILFATQIEAAPFFAEMAKRHESAESDDSAVRIWWKDTEIAAAVIGMGKGPAETGARAFIERHHPERIVNAGIAGALVDSLEIGGLYCVSSAVGRPDGPEQPISCDPTGLEDLKTARLVTCDTPVFDAAKRRSLSAFGELVDMEGAAVASVCVARNVPFSAVKCVSDFAGKGDRDTLHRNIQTVSKTLAVRLATLFFAASS